VAKSLLLIRCVGAYRCLCVWLVCCSDAGKPVWEIMLKPNEVWYQLAAIHCRLTAACASPHKLMALGGISVLMRLLEVRPRLTPYRPFDSILHLELRLRHAPLTIELLP
jgi:hypothetical protein